MLLRRPDVRVALASGAMPGPGETRGARMPVVRATTCVAAAGLATAVRCRKTVAPVWVMQRSVHSARRWNMHSWR